MSWLLQVRLKLTLHWLEHKRVWGHPQKGYSGNSPTRSLESIQYMWSNFKIHVLGLSSGQQAQTYPRDTMPNSFRPAECPSKDVQQNKLDHSPGRALQHVPGPVDALRRTWPANRSWEDFLNPSAAKPQPLPQHHKSLNYKNCSNNALGTLFPTRVTKASLSDCPFPECWHNHSMESSPPPPADTGGKKETSVHRPTFLPALATDPHRQASYKQCKKKGWLIKMISSNYYKVYCITQNTSLSNQWLLHWKVGMKN